MGKSKYAGTRIKGAEPRVRFNVPRRDDGRFVGERAMGGIIVDKDGNEVPIVANRVVFQCEHGDDAAHWQGVAGITGFEIGSVDIRCDVCRFTARIPRQDLAGLFILATDHDFVSQYHGLIGIGFHDGRPGAGYAVVNLKAAPNILKVWHARLAEDREAD